MHSIDSIIGKILGNDFQIDCHKIEIRGRNDFEEPYFSGIGFISGKMEGAFSFRLFNTLEKQPKELIQLARSANENAEPMRLFADDYQDNHWAGAWFIPEIDISDSGRCIISGEFQQLSTRKKFTKFDTIKNTTAIYYHGILDLPLQSGVCVQRIRDGNIESQSVYRDLCKLNFDNSEVMILVNQEKKQMKVSSTHRGGWTPPFCEVGLADSLAFVSATFIRPRITIRYFNEDALIFIRKTPEDTRTGMPRALARDGKSINAFWNIFLAFLKDCEVRQDFYSTPLSRAFSELVLASTGTINGLILSLVVTIEETVKQIVGERSDVPQDLSNLKEHIEGWKGDPELRESAIKILSSSLSRVSTPQHLKQLISKGVVTKEQVDLWRELRPKVAHGKIVDYTDEQLMTKRNQLISMYYRLALRLLKYQGPATNYASWPPETYEFQWEE